MQRVESLPSQSAGLPLTSPEHLVDSFRALGQEGECGRLTSVNSPLTEVGVEELRRIRLKPVWR